MAKCDITKGRLAIACRDAVGGIKNIYLANQGDYEYEFVGVPGPSASEAGFTLTDLGNLSEVFQYRVKNSGNTFEQPFESSVDNGTTVYNPTLTVALTKLSPDLELQVYLMAISNPQVFIETQQGDILLMGMDNGVQLAGNTSIGGGMGDFTGFNLTFTGQEKYPALYLSETSKTALKQLISSNNI